MTRERLLRLAAHFLGTLLVVYLIVSALILPSLPDHEQAQQTVGYIFLALLLVGLGFGVGAWTWLDRLSASFRQAHEIEAHYRHVIETLPEAIGLVSPDGTWLSVNTQTVALLKVGSPVQLVGQSIFRWIASEDQARLTEDLARAKTARAIHRAEYRLVRADGTQFLGEMSLSLASNGSAPPSALITIIRDATDRKQTQDALRDKIAELQTLSEIDQAITSAMGLTDRIDILLKCVRAQMHTDLASVMLLDRSTLELQAFAEQGIQSAEAWSQVRFKVGEGAGGWIAENDQPLAIPDVDSDTRWKPMALATDEHIVSYVGAPLHVEGRVIGVLEVATRVRREFTQDEVNFLATLAGRTSIAIENARLFDELQRRASEFVVLYDTTRDLATHHDTLALLQIVVDRATSLLNVKSGHIYLFDRDHQELEVAIAGHFPVAVGTRLRLGEGMAGRVAQTRRPIIVDDYQSWEHRATQYEGIPFTSVLQVPMIYSGELIGVLGVNEVERPPHERHKFTETDEHLLTLFAAQAASAVHNARLFQETRARAEQLALLYDAGLALNSVLEPRAQLEFLLKIAMKALRADRACFYRYSPDENLLRIDHALGYPEPARKELDRQAFPVTGTENAVTWVAMQRVPLRIGDSAADPRWLPTDPDPGSGLWAPILHEQQLLGVAAVLCGRPNAFAPQDERLLVLFANQLSVALDNARLLGQAWQRAEQLDALNRMSRTLASTLDLQEIYRVAMYHVRQLVDCPMFGLWLYDSKAGRVYPTFLAHDGAELDVEGIDAVPFETHSSHGLARAIVSAQPIISNCLSANDGKGTEIPASAPEVHSALYLPMIVENHVFGLVELKSRRIQSYRQEDADLLGPAANQIGLAIHNAQLFLEIAQRAQQLALVNQVSQTVNQPFAIGQVLQNTLAELARVLNVDRGGVAIFTSAGDDHLTVIAEHNPANGHTAIGQAIPLAGNAALECVLREHQPLAVADARAAGMLGSLGDLIESIGTQSLLTVPLTIGDRVIGVIGLDSVSTPRIFTDTELVLAQTIANQAAAAIEKARLYEETSRRADQLALLNRIADAVNRTMDLDELLHIIHAQVTAAIHADAFFVALYDPSTSEMDYRVRVDRGISQPPERRPLTVGLTAQVVRSKAPLLIRDWEREVPRLHSFVLWGSMEAPRSWLGVPLLVEDDVVGAINIQSYEPNAYGEEELRLLTTIADQLAVVVARARLFDETKRRALEQSTISEIANALNAALDVREAFPAVVEGLRRLVNCERVSLALTDESQKQVFFVALDSPRSELARGTYLSLGATSSADDLLAGRPHLTPDLEQERTSPGERALYEAGFRSRVNVPLLVGERVIGALNLASRQVQAFSNAQLPALQQIANAVGVAIENTRLYESEQTRRAQLTALYELSSALADATDYDTTLSIITKHAVQALHVTLARVALREGSEFVTRAAYPIHALGRDLSIGMREPVAALPCCLHALDQNSPTLLDVDDGSLSEHERATLFLEIAKTLCLVPLRIGERAIGILMLGQARRETHEAFTEDQVLLAHSIGDQAASALRRVELFGELEHSYLQTVLSLANAVDARDTYTGDHAERLADIALRVGVELGMEEKALEDLRYGALLHDIGKIGISDAILQEPGPLSSLQWSDMRRHPEIGAKILSPVKRLAGAADIVHHHHERYDGKGYPEGTGGEAIPLGARILAVVDAYTAIVDKRVYKLSGSHLQAVAELERNCGTQFDPRVVAAFLQVIEANP